MQTRSTLAAALCESEAYRAKKPRHAPPGDASNFPTLCFLYDHALQILARQPKTRTFTFEGVSYGVVWLGIRKCVMHESTGIILVGDPGPRYE